MGRQGERSRWRLIGKLLGGLNVSGRSIVKGEGLDGGPVQYPGWDVVENNRNVVWVSERDCIMLSSRGVDCLGGSD